MHSAEHLSGLAAGNRKQEFIKELPSVTPARKKGKWIDTDGTILNRQGYLVHDVICSECDGISYFRSMGNKHIGAKMDEDGRTLKYSDQDTMMSADGKERVDEDRR